MIIFVRVWRRLVMDSGLGERRGGGVWGGANGVNEIEHFY